MFPSLLNMNREKRKELSAEFFKDTYLDKLLTQNILDIFKYPCDAVDIYERHAMQKYIASDDGNIAVHDFYMALLSLSRAYEVFNHSLCKLESAVFFSQLMHKYLDCILSARRIKPESEMTKRFSLFWSSDDMNAYTALLEADLAENDSLISQISNATARFSRGVMLVDFPRSETAIIDRLRKGLASVGISESQQKRPSHIKINSGISDAYIQLYPEQYAVLNAFTEKYNRDDIFFHMLQYREEIEFYYYIVEFFKKLEDMGIPSCFPEISKSREYFALSCFDISLTLKNSDSIIPNDIDFDEKDRFCFLTGANGGGKTTYIRTCALTLAFFLAGAPVPCRSARIYPFKKVYTHFPGDERFADSGRLLEESKRVKAIIDSSDADTFVFLNETFSGTDEQLALSMTLDAWEKFKDHDTFGLFVTHFHEVSESGAPILATVIDESDENRRTFRVVKSTGTHSSYARDILKKYRLTRDALELRSVNK